MAARKSTRRSTKHLTGKLDNGRTIPWRADEKERLIAAVKKEKRIDQTFQPSAPLQDENKNWKAVAKAVRPGIPERNTIRCHQHYNNMLKDVERIILTLQKDGIGWNDETHMYTGGQKVFDRHGVRPAAAAFMKRPFPYLDDIMQIEGINPRNSAENHMETDREGEEMKDVEGAEKNEKEESGKKEQKKENKSEKNGKKESSKTESKKDNKKEKTSANEEDEDEKKKRPEKGAAQKAGKTAKSKAQKKSQKKRQSGSEDGYVPETTDDEGSNEASSSRESTRYLTEHDEHGGEIIQIPTFAFNNYELTHSRDEELVERVGLPKTKDKRKKADDSHIETSLTDDEGLRVQPIAPKQIKNKRKLRASSSPPSSPTFLRSSKQPKISDHVDAAAVMKKVKQESSRSAFSFMEEPILQCNERERKGCGKGKAARDAPQMPTPVKTSPAPRRTANDDEDRQSPDAGADEGFEKMGGVRESAKREVRSDPLLSSHGKYFMVRRFEQSEADAKAYLDVMDDIEIWKACLADIIKRGGEDPEKCFK